MKYTFGLLLLITCFQVLAGEALILRGRVPASTKIVKDSMGQIQLKTNELIPQNSPQISVLPSEKHTLVTVIQR